MKRFLSLLLTAWPIDRLRRDRRRRLSAASGSFGAAQAEPPFALTERAARGLRVVAANPPAAAAGVVPGLTLADARARLPDLESEPVDRIRDRASLEALGHWAVRFTPTVALDGSNGLMLDITGSAHLFGGEAALMADLSARLHRAGFAHRIGVGPTKGAAWALAHGGTAPLARLGQEVATERAILAGLADLPADALRLGADTLTLLRRFGLTRIDQIAALDRAALARRFQSLEAADRVLLRIDQTLGRVAEPLRPLRPPPEHVARLPCPEPLLDLAGLEAGLEQLLARLGRALAAAGLGGRRFRLMAYRSDGTVGQLEVAAARPTRDPSHLMRLFAERLARLDPGHGVDLLTLDAESFAPMAEAVRPLVRHGPGAGEDPECAARLAALADRLAARLGDGAVRVPAPQESHGPENSERWAGFAEAAPDWACTAIRPQPGARPVRLLARPEPIEVIAGVPDGPPVRFTWRRVVRAVARADGPERIAPDWWSADPGSHGRAGGQERMRDYFRVEDAEGTRYWLFRNGLYGVAEAPGPHWYLHGLFA